MNRRGLFKFALALSGLPLVRRIPAVKRWRYRYDYRYTATAQYKPLVPFRYSRTVIMPTVQPPVTLQVPVPPGTSHVEVYRTTAKGPERIA